MEQYQPSDIDRKATRRSGSTCLQNCCLLIVGGVAVLALCVAVAAIILVVGFPSVTNPAAQEVLALRDELMSTNEAQTNALTGEKLRMIRETLQSSVSALGSTLEDTINMVRASLENTSLSLQRIRDTVESSVNSLDNSLGVRINTVRSSLENTITPVNTLLERLVSGKENETCVDPPELMIGSLAYPVSSCRDISADRPSGNYWILLEQNTCPIEVYCDLDGSACACRCDTTQGGWMRVANLDMKDPNQNCPENFTEVTNTNPPLRLCARPGPVGCSTIIYPVNGIQYSRVCGKVIGYRKGTPDGFNNHGIDSNYADGVSITHGSPRTHIWSFVASWGFTTSDVGCPCDTNNYGGAVPSFVGNDYFCEAGHATQCCNFNLATDNPVWDGQDCVEESGCCGFNNPPYFCKTLDTPTTNPIEVRMCGNQATPDEDTPLESIELYVY